MAEKKSKKLSWECKHGCGSTKKPCKHLEKLLRPLNDGHSSYQVLGDYKEYSRLTPNEVFNDSELVKLLAKYGLKNWEIDLLLDRYVANLSLREISKRYGYLDNKKVWRLLEELTERLSKSPVLRNLLLRRIQSNEV